MRDRRDAFAPSIPLIPGKEAFNMASNAFASPVVPEYSCDTLPMDISFLLFFRRYCSSDSLYKIWKFFSFSSFYSRELMDVYIGVECNDMKTRQKMR